MPKKRAGRRAAPAAGACALLLLAVSCGPSVTVRRLVPAPYNLGPAKRLVLVETVGPYAARSLVTSRFVSAVRAGGIFQIADATGEDIRISQLGSGEAAREARAFRRDWPADVYVRLEVAELEARRRSETKKQKDRDGNEFETKRFWAEAVCELQVAMMDGRNGRDVATYRVHETRRSERKDSWNARLLEHATDAAADAAVAEAVDQFTPRRVDESLSLDEKAPLAEEGIRLIEAGDPRGARHLWEKALEAHPEDARLYYNLGAVSEAVGDPRAAREYYEDAIRLNPSEENYRRALEALDQRQRDAEALRKRG